jgi:hypothetical protein
VRIIVSVATENGHRPFVAMQDRLLQRCLRLGSSSLKFWRGELPAGCPTNIPYAFKVYALLMTAAEHPDCTLLWADSSVYPLQNLEPLWNLIEEQGYWFSNAPPWHSPPWNCGQWTCDSALPILGITREEAFGITQLHGACFGLDLRHPIANRFLLQWNLMAGRGAFNGPWSNENGEASADPRVMGHRHDQTAASVIAHKLGMALTEQPKWLTDQIPPTEETFIDIRRSL